MKQTIKNKFREFSSYLLFGMLTTLVNIIVFYVFDDLFSLNYLISNVIAWFISVLFAYFTNRRYVFKGHKVNTLKTMFIFFFSRLSTLAIDIFLMFFMVEMLNVEAIHAKVFIQLVVMTLNYLFSKFFVFRERD